MQPPIGQQGEDCRVLPGHPGRPDALERRLLGQLQLGDAVREHGWMPRRSVQPPVVDFSEVR